MYKIKVKKPFRKIAVTNITRSGFVRVRGKPAIFKTKEEAISTKKEILKFNFPRSKARRVAASRVLKIVGVK